MSKYTTELRWICEQAYIDYKNSHPEIDLPELIEANLNAIINAGCNKIFWKNKETPDNEYDNIDNEFPIYDENHRKELCFKIIKHYYTREIAAETFGLWKLWINERMNEIMPYFNKLYESADITYNPLYDVDYKRSGNKSGLDTRENTKENEKTGSNSYLENGNQNNSRHIENDRDSENSDISVNETNSENIDKFSETPQNGLSGVLDGTYLTTADVKTGENNSNTSNLGNQKEHNEAEETNENNYNRNGNSVNTENENTSEKNINTNNNIWEEEIKGKIGRKSYAKMIIEYRDAILNIDKMIIDELKDLFFYLW